MKLAGNLAMSQQGRSTKCVHAATELEYKLGEFIWWLIVLAKRMNTDISEGLDEFLF